MHAGGSGAGKPRVVSHAIEERGCGHDCVLVQVRRNAAARTSEVLNFWRAPCQIWSIFAEIHTDSAADGRKPEQANDRVPCGLPAERMAPAWGLCRTSPRSCCLRARANARDGLLLRDILPRRANPRAVDRHVSIEHDLKCRARPHFDLVSVT